MADEYFGEYPNRAQVEIKKNDERQPSFVLLRDFLFKDPNGLDWLAPTSTEVDGTSIPRFL